MANINSLDKNTKGNCADTPLLYKLDCDDNYGMKLLSSIIRDYKTTLIEKIIECEINTCKLLYAESHEYFKEKLLIALLNKHNIYDSSDSETTESIKPLRALRKRIDPLYNTTKTNNGPGRPRKLISGKGEIMVSLQDHEIDKDISDLRAFQHTKY